MANNSTDAVPRTPYPYPVPYGDAYVHVIRSASGRHLYRVLPWYTRRREFIRTVGRRVREAQEAEAEA